MSSAKKSSAKKPPPCGPKTLKGSREAKRLATVILEVLSGLVSTTEASELLEIALPRYYLLETRALQGLISALEPRPRGRQKSVESVIAGLEADNKRLEQELSRLNALIRSAHRAIGLKSTSPTQAASKSGAKAGAKSGKRKVRRGKPRAVKAIEVLRASADDDEGLPELPVE